MTQEDITRMALEAGMELDEPIPIWLAHSYELERFAALVAAAERDRMCEQFNIPKELVHEKAKGNETN